MRQTVFLARWSGAGQHNKRQWEQIMEFELLCSEKDKARAFAAHAEEHNLTEVGTSLRDFCAGFDAAAKVIAQSFPSISVADMAILMAWHDQGDGGFRVSKDDYTRLQKKGLLRSAGRGAVGITDFGLALLKFKG